MGHIWIIHASRQPRRCFQVVDNIPGYFRQPRPLLVSLGTDPRLTHRLCTDKEKFDSQSAKVYSRKTTFNLVLVVALVLLGLLWLRTSMSLGEGGGLSTWYWLLVRWYCCCRVSTPSPAVGCSVTASSTLLWFIKCNTGKHDQIDPTKGQQMITFWSNWLRQRNGKYKIQRIENVSPWSAILLHVILHFCRLSSPFTFTCGEGRGPGDSLPGDSWDIHNQPWCFSRYKNQVYLRRWYFSPVVAQGRAISTMARTHLAVL